MSKVKEYVMGAMWLGLLFVLIYFIGNLIADTNPAWRSIIYVLLAMAGTASGILSWLNEQEWYDKVVAEYEPPMFEDDERQNDPVLRRLGRSADLLTLGSIYGIGLSFGLICYVEAGWFRFTADM